MNNNNHNYNPNHEVEEVEALGADYFSALIYRVESHNIKVHDITKSITNQFEFGRTLTPKQAAVLMNFKRAFDP